MRFSTSEGHEEICSPGALAASLQVLEAFQMWKRTATVCVTAAKTSLFVGVIVDL